MKRTDEQNSVIQANLPKFAVKAAAGSGKTSVLVERYVRHVVELGHSPETLATVTFTRKAAAEMKTRIVERLRLLGKHDEAQAAETGPIQTIHSFCERLLRENAVEAEVDPRFSVLEGPKRTAFGETAIRESLLVAREENDAAASLVDRLSGRGARNAPASAHGQLRFLVKTCLEKLRGTGLDRNQLQEIYKSPASVLDYWSGILLSEYPEVLSDGLFAGYDPNWGRSLSDRLKAANQKSPHFAKSQNADSDLQTATDTCGLVWLATTAWANLESMMLFEQEFDFQFLESKAVQLLQHSEVVRERLQSSFHALLIDEAQDLNPMQYRLIDSIQARGEMLVGDAQQSIYGFRFAERTLFVERCNELDSFQLTKNFRSTPGILNFVDAVFEPQWGEAHMSMRPGLVDGDDPFGPAIDRDCTGVELWPQESKDTGEIAALIKQIVDEGTDPSSIAVLMRYNASINQLTPKLTALGVPNRVVGASEKFYTRLEVRDLANALEALADPREDYSMLALLRSPFVGLSIDACVWLASKGAVIEKLEEPGPWGEQDSLALAKLRTWFETGKQMADRVPAWETISYLLANTPFLESIARKPLAEQAIANVRKLLTLATEEPEANARDFAQQIRDIQFLRHGEGEAPVLDESTKAVTIMTVHKAKGLEFDCVVLPETLGRLSPKKTQVAYDAPNGLIAASFEKPVSAFQQWIADKEVEAGREEELRVLYVALTRAKSRLCVVVSPSGGQTTASEILALRSGYPKRLLPGLKVRKLHIAPE